METIALVDDEPGMLKALSRLLQIEGYCVLRFNSAEEFLSRPVSEKVDCLVLDVSMPGKTGLELQEWLKEKGSLLPIIFLTGQGDVPMSVRAIKAGAVNFLTKPVNDVDLLGAIRVGLEEGLKNLTEEQELKELRAKVEELTPREMEVFRHVIAGKLNKQIAGDLGTSEQTIKVHRMRVTDKMGMPSVAELTRAAGRLAISPIG